jgi:prevent-host-death family protein
MVTKTMTADQFQSKCLDLLSQVQRNRLEVIVTKRGKPIARLVPMSSNPPEIFGCMKGTVRILGDIISPIDVGWDALKV